MANAKDIDPYSFEKYVTKAIASTIIAIFLVISSCCAHIDYRISQAIEAGSDPVLARAAFSNSDGAYERLVHIAKKER